MSIKKVSVVGHFGFGEELLNGQTIKTKIVTEELERRLGKNEVIKVDTHGGKGKLLLFPIMLLRVLIKSRNVIIFPAHNGVRIIAPLLVLGKIFFRRKLHYVVIGAWLPQLLENKKCLSRVLKKFDSIYVETTIAKKALEAQGFSNIVLMPNCKKLAILQEEELVYANEQPYNLCTFSRVMKEKGIEDAINVVQIINQKYGKVIYSLDIYGPIDSEQLEWFETIAESFPHYIRYCGAVPFDSSVNVIKNYFALLFPTKFYTEGIPGTILDAYAAGVPVIASKWESFGDLIADESTGIGYEFGKTEELINVLEWVAQHPIQVFNKKINCIEKAKMYLPENVVKSVIENLQ